MEEIKEDRDTKNIREILLNGYAETMKLGDKISFESGEIMVTMFCVGENTFQVMYQSKNPLLSQINQVYSWDSKNNIWQ